MRYVHVLSKGDLQDIQRAAVDLAYTSMLAGHVVAVAADKHSIDGISPHVVASEGNRWP